MAESKPPIDPAASNPEEGVGKYSWYALSVLVLVYMFNFIDRQILSILNEDIIADLGLDDAKMGFLFGTAFAVFYAIFGIPLGRLADMWVRKRLISIGLFFWSLMTVLSGTAKSFGSLATFRIGVGVGESSASPAAFSMLGDYFPPRMRATAVAIYSSGVYIGSGVGMLIGGQIVDRWNAAFPDKAAAPFGLAGWQAAFFAVGAPGLLMALWVWTLREPVRGSSEGLPEPEPHPAPFKELGAELASVIPPFTFFSLMKGVGVSAVVKNLIIGAGCASAAWLLTTLVGSPAQWIAFFVGLYAFFSWLQGLHHRDHSAFSMIYRCRTMIFGIIGFAWLAFVGYGGGYFGAPFFQRVHGVSASEAGTVLGLISASAGLIGVAGGGIVSDWLRRRTGKARIICGLACAITSLPLGYLTFTLEETRMAYIAFFFFSVTSSSWIGSAVALSNELVIPRMRGTASAYYILVVTFIGLALGPYTMGQISTTLSAGGMDSGEALRTGVLWGLGAYVLAIVFLFFAGQSVEKDEASRLDRARALGESV